MSEAGKAFPIVASPIERVSSSRLTSPNRHQQLLSPSGAYSAVSSPSSASGVSPRPSYAKEADKLLHFKAKFDGIEHERKTLLSKYDSLSGQFQLLTAQHQDTTETLKQVIEEKKLLAKQNNTLHSDLEEEQQRRKHLNNQYDLAVTRCESLKVRATEQEQQILSLQTELTMVKQELEDVLNRQHELGATETEKDTYLDAALDRIHMLEESKEQLKSELARVRQIHQMNNDTHMVSHSELDALSKQNSDLESVCDKLHRQVKNATYNEKQAKENAETIYAELTRQCELERKARVNTTSS